MAYTKKAINAKYDKLRAQLKSGTIDQKKFKAAANRLYELYHSDANKATRNAKPKPPVASKPPVTSKPKPKQKPATPTTANTKPVSKPQSKPAVTSKPKLKDRGRQSIADQVSSVNPSNRRDQTTAQARRRRAREEGLRRNRREMLSRRYNKE